MPLQTAGVLMCRWENSKLEVFFVHPGGPFYAKKNEGVWSIPKGIPEAGEELEAAAIREFMEETGIQPAVPVHFLASLKLKSGKMMHVWTFLGNWDEANGITSNSIEMEWPPRSGKMISIPETDRGEWMSLEKASVLINPGQVPFLQRAQLFYGNKND